MYKNKSYINVVKMLMMNAMQMMRMLKLIDMHHSFELSTKLWRMSKVYMSLPWHVLAYTRFTKENTTSSSRIFIKILIHVGKFVHRLINVIDLYLYRHALL